MAVSKGTVLVVDDEEVILDVLSRLFSKHREYEVLLAADKSEAERILALQPVDLVLLDLFLGGDDGMELLRWLKNEEPERPVIMMTAHGSVETAVEAMKAGAFHYLTKPFQNDEVLLLADAALNQRRLAMENAGLRRALAERRRFGRLVGRSRAMQDVYRLIQQVAPARTTVLITGESGTGKELTAEAIHQLGPRAEAPFITVNSSNLPPDLLESHLFGHVKGAFTGAMGDREGLFAAAAGGTIFFDEISTIPPSVQAKLLRVMQEKEFLPLGSVQPVRVDVRILAATNENLESLLAQGRFREDLFYRLNVISVHLPALRERREDIPLLTEHFLAELGDENSRPGLRIGREAMALLVQADWPGNVRQLRNTIERAILLATHDEITPELLGDDSNRSTPRDLATASIPPGMDFQTAVEAYETALIRNALEECEGVQRRAAERLGMKATTLSERMKRLGIR